MPLRPKHLNILVCWPLLLFTLLISQFTHGQDAVRFAETNSTVTEKTMDGGALLHEVKVIVTNPLTKDIFLKVNPSGLSTANPEDYSIVRETLHLPKNTAKDVVFSFLVLINADTDTTENNETLILKLEQVNGEGAVLQDNNMHMVTIADNTANNTYAAADFRIDVGTNFSLLDGVDASGLYVNAFVFAPDLVNIFKSKSKPAKPGLNVGLYAGIRQDRSYNDTASAINTVSIYEQIGPENGQASNDTVNYRLIRYDVSTKTQFDNTRLFLSPLFRLSQGRRASFYLGLNLEVIRRDYRTTFTNAILDTTEVAIPRNRRPRSTRIRDGFNRVYFDYQYSVGFPFRFSVKAANFSFTPSIGVASSLLTPKVFIGTRFNVIEPTSGVNLGGEVTSFLDRRDELSSFAPLINIYVAKAFNIKPIGDYKATF